MKKLKTAIIGLGYIGESHIEAVHRIGLCELYGVFDANLETARNKAAYYGIPKCYESIDELLTALAELIRNLAVDRLHVVGDIYDRGPRADSIMDILMQHHAVDIEWGNHDILWMGAASGSEACIAAVVRNALAYGNMTILERGYGIPLRELTLFAEFGSLNMRRACSQFSVSV